jgi:hypothetical protein
MILAVAPGGGGATGVGRSLRLSQDAAAFQRIDWSCPGNEILAPTPRGLGNGTVLRPTTTSSSITRIGFLDSKQRLLQFSFSCRRNMGALTFVRLEDISIRFKVAPCIITVVTKERLSSTVFYQFCGQHWMRLPKVGVGLCPRCGATY